MRKWWAAMLAAGVVLAVLLWVSGGQPPKDETAVTPLWPIPGLGANNAGCPHMTPQGVCLGGEAVFVSAYCGQREHDSLIYVLHRETGDHLATIPLGLRTHAGGLAYREGRLYVACRDGDMAQVAVISAPALRAAAAAGCPPVMERWDLPDLPRASFLTCRGDTLYIGTFSLTGDGVVGTYPLDGTGAPGRAGLRNGRPAARCETVTPIPDRVQGMTFYREQVLFSCSFGTGAASEILVFPEHSRYTEADAAARLPLPPMLEQIAAEGDRLYLVFESAARQYRGRCDRPIDCVCGAALPRLLGENGNSPAA